MKKTSETIVFFGSGPVADICLAKLNKVFSIEAVITKPKPDHHKYNFPVIETAQKLSLKTYTPNNKIELTETFSKVSLKSKLGLVIDYGIIIPQKVIDYFPLGIINSHFSLLPKLRGPDPISFSILTGDKSTGVSLMLINNKMDEGPILVQERLSLDNDITTEQLTDRLIDLSHELLIKTIPKFINGKIQPHNQKGIASYTRKLTKNDSLIDWQKSATRLEREIRAFNGWPRSITNLGSHKIIITKAHVHDGNGKPGHIILKDKLLGVQTADGVLIIDTLIPIGKKEMSANSFLAGYKIML